MMVCASFVCMKYKEQMCLLWKWDLLLLPKCHHLKNVTLFHVSLPCAVADGHVEKKN